MKRNHAAVLAIASAIAIVALLIATLLDLDRGVKVATILGAVVAVLTLAVSVAQLLKTAPVVRTVRALGKGSIAAGGGITGNAMGRGSEVVTGSGSQAHFDAGHGPIDVLSEGKNSIAGGGSITWNAVGKESMVSREEKD